MTHLILATRPQNSGGAHYDLIANRSWWYEINNWMV